jgi:peptide/nickel transport system substrate-binding protein
MSKLLRTHSRWLLLPALALLLTACPADDDAAEPDPDAPPVDEEEETPEPDPDEVREGGTLVFGQDQEPAILNPHLTAGNMFATSIVVNGTILLPLWRITPDFEYEPLLLDGEPEVDEGPPMRVTYTLREEAAWSDGTPVTSRDVEFTMETTLNEDWDITSRVGWENIDEFETVDDKTFAFVFEEPYAAWRTIGSVTGILPAHAIEGEDFNTVWDDTIADSEGNPISNGPYIFESWDRGRQIVIVRNEDYWDTDNRANIDRIVYRPIEDSATQVQQLRGGEVDLLYPQPQLDLVRQFDEIADVEYQVDAGPIWEHLDFQFTNPALALQYVRQAIAMGFNRQDIIDQFIQPIHEESVPLNNIIYVNNQEEYEDNWGEAIPYDPEGAIALLEENGCTRGDDDIFECEGNRLEFNYVTTAGNERRELAFEVIQAQVREIGVQFNADFSEPAVAFGERLAPGDWDLFNFAWVGAPDPEGGLPAWECEGGLNYTGYCDEQVDELITQSKRELDPAERARLLNEADALMAQAVPVIPLYQFPTIVVYRDHIQGVRENPTQWGPFWNISEWYLTD